MGKRGRPRGHRLSAETKKQISESKKGFKHDEETKQQIRESVQKHWDKARAVRFKNMFELYEEGEMRVEDIAKMFHTTPKTLYKLIRERENENER